MILASTSTETGAPVRRAACLRDRATVRPTPGHQSGSAQSIEAGPELNCVSREKTYLILDRVGDHDDSVDLSNHPLATLSSA